MTAASRRLFLARAASVLAAPAIVRASSLMPVVPVRQTMWADAMRARLATFQSLGIDVVPLPMNVGFVSQSIDASDPDAGWKLGPPETYVITAYGRKRVA